VTESSKAVFLSYASQDAEVAKRICDALRVSGIEVWFDQSELRGGDAWDQTIRRQIKDCALFIPLISAATQERTEGYFRREWRIAVERNHDMADDTAFLLPVVIDGTPDAVARVPERFRDIQWTHLPNGNTPSAFVERVSRLLSPHPNTGPTTRSAASVAPRLPSHEVSSWPRWMPWLVGATAVIAGTYFAADKLIILKGHLGQTSGTAVPTALPMQNASREPPFSPPAHSVAVLPFTNLSGDPTQEYFSDGISEELINALSHIEALQVTSRTSSFSFRGQNVDLGTIARKLNVAAILEGSIRRSGNTVRITAQLINARSGFHMWSQDYDRGLRNILQLQTEIATTVALQLQAKLLGDETNRIELGGTHNPEAYDAYLRALKDGSLASLSGSEAELRVAVADFDRAISLDPTFALAYVGRAYALHNLVARLSVPSQRAGLREQALRAAERAVAISPNLGETHAALAFMRTVVMFDYWGAGPEFERALALAPGNARVQTDFAWYAADLGHFEQALNAARRAAQLDPQNYYPHVVLGSVLKYARHYQEAMSAYQDAIRIKPAVAVNVNSAVADTLIASGAVEKARTMCESAAVPMQESDRHYCLALSYRALAQSVDAEHELGEFQSLNGHAAAYEYAALYAQWRDTPAALKWLVKAERLRDPHMWILKVDWRLDPIRSEPEFKAIVARMNFPP